MKLLKFSFIPCYIFLLTTNIWTRTSNTHIYKPVTELNQKLAKEGLKMSAQQSSPILSPNEIQRKTSISLISSHQNHIPQGSQPDIDKFNQQRQRDHSSIFYPRPFNNKTNSYWLNPDFQFGPGSVNDFGGGPNAKEMLQPFIF